MSWLFDRLCELAAADQVEVVIATHTAEPLRLDDSTDFAEVLLRASEMPRLTVWVLPSPSGRTCSLTACEDIDLDVLSPRNAREAMRRVLTAQRSATDVALRVGADSVSLVRRSASEVMSALATESSVDLRQMFVTDQPGHTEILGRVGRHGMGVAVGGVDPSASVQVSDIVGVVSIVDALVTLRCIAFGVNRGGPSAAASGRLGDASR